MREDGDGHNLPDQQYPKGPVQRACHQPRHRRHSSRKRWGRRPIEQRAIVSAKVVQAHDVDMGYFKDVMSAACQMKEQVKKKYEAANNFYGISLDMLEPSTS